MEISLPRSHLAPYADGVTDPIVSLDSDHLSVEPGGQVSVSIKITNPGTIVEGYRVEVVGEGVSDWGEALPPELSIYPKQDGNAVIVFSPPGGTGAPGGTWPFGIRVRSTEDADASAVAEGDLEIGKVFGLQAKLVPVNSSGRWRGRHVVQLSNWGNAPARITLSATNPDDALAFMIRPEVVELPLGGTANAMVWVKTKKPILRGTVARLPFTITGEQVGAAPQQGPALPYGGTPDRPTVDGALNQKPILSRGAVMVAAIALLAVAGGVVYALTRPQPAQASFQELGPPPQPKAVKVAVASPESVSIQWEPVPDVEGYKIVQELADGAQTDAGVASATENAKNVGKLAPGTNVCFKVRAERGKTPGPFSEKQCVDLPGAVTSASPTPGGSPSAPVSSPGGPSSSVIDDPNNPGGPGNPGNPGDPGSSSGPPTGPDTSSPGTSPGSPGTGPGNGGPQTTVDPAFKGKWFDVGIWPMSQTSQGLIEGKATALKAKNVPSGFAPNSTFPRAAFTPPLVGPTWILYTGPFETREQAAASCGPIREVQSDCLQVQLEP